MRATGWCLFLLVAGSGWLAAQEPELVAEAVALEKQGKPAAAVERYQTILEGNEEAVSWRMSRALVDMSDETGNKGRKRDLLDRALEVAQAGVEAAPDSAYTQAAVAAVNGKRALIENFAVKSKLARDIHDRAAKANELDPSYALPYIILGAWHREVVQLNAIQRTGLKIMHPSLPDGSLEESEKYLRRAVSLEPDNPRAYFELGLTCLAMEKKDEARLLLEKATRTKPRFVGERQVLRKAQAELDELDELDE